MDIQPDGGWGWIIVLCGFCCNFMIDGFGYSFGILLPYLMDGFDTSPSIASLAGIVGGPLIDRFSCRLVGILGSCLTCAGIFLGSFAVNIWMFLLTFGLIGGCGMGLLYLSAIVIVNHYFNTKRGRAQGCMLSGSGFGLVCISPLTKILLEIYSWRGTLIIFAGLFFQLSVGCALFRPVKLQKQIQHKNQNIIQEYRKSVGKLLMNKRFMIVSVGVFFNQLALIVPLTFVGKVGLSRGLSLSEVSWIYSVYGITHVAGRLCPGIIVDKTSITSACLCSIGTLGCAISCLLIPFYTTYSALITFASVYGFFIAFFSVLCPLMVLESVDLSILTKGISFVIFIRGPAAISGSPITGRIFEYTKDYNITLLFAGCLLLMASVLYMSYPLYQFIYSTLSKPEKKMYKTRF